MLALMKELMNGDLHPELFAQFTLQALGQRLTGVLFASGHLPESGQVASLGTPGDEELAFAKNQTGCYLNNHFTRKGELRVCTLKFSFFIF